MGNGFTIRVPRKSPPNRDKTSLSKKEVMTMFEAAKDDVMASAILKMLYYSGIRKDELIKLDMEDVDLQRLQVTIKHGKGDRSRTVNITHDCADAIKTYLLTRSKPSNGHENALFISKYGTRISGQVAQTAVKKYVAHAGITKHIYPHKFRITMITHMAEAGCTLNEIQAQSGHTDVTTLLGYIQHSPNRIRTVYERVFERNDKLVIETPQHVSVEEAEHYKKKAFERYLNGDIDRKTLDMILHSYENAKHTKEELKDVAYC